MTMIGKELTNINTQTGFKINNKIIKAICLEFILITKFQQ